MRTIGYINRKGGVGKTTVSINTAYALGEEFDQNRVLVIDADEQGNSSTWFEADASRGSLTDILTHEAKAEDVIQHTRYKNIDIIPADSSLILANFSVLEDKNTVQHNILPRALESVKKDYDLCIIDNPPGSNLSVLNCLEVIDDLIAVTLPNRFSLSGIDMVQADLDNFKSVGLDLKIRGVLINQYNSRSTEAWNSLNGKYNIFPPVRGGKNTQLWLDRMINEHKSIYELSPNSGYAHDFKRFILKLVDVIMADMSHQPIKF